jgi:hypothetical protein
MYLNQKLMITLLLIPDRGTFDVKNPFNFIRAKADPFGRDIQILGLDIKSKQKALGIWQDRSTRTVKAKDDQQAEAPDFARYQ